MNNVIELKKTPLHGWHVENGAKMGIFGEWAMPMSYGSEMKEWLAVREKAGLFDVSHMKMLSIVGSGAERFLQFITTNDVARLKKGDVQYTILCNEWGGILEDTTLYKYSSSEFFFVINASNVKKISDRLQNILSSALQGPRAEDILSRVFQPDDMMNIFALQGPRAEDILSRVFRPDDIPRDRYSFKEALSGAIIISRTGYTGEDGFEILCQTEDATDIWESILTVGKTDGLLPCGLVARDMLRTEAGMRLYGNDIDETTNSIEAGLERYVSFDKGDFIGKSAIEKALALKNRGGGRFFTGFTVDGKPEHGCPIFESSLVPDEIGTITSATYSPFLKKRIALGYLRERKTPGEIVYVKIGENYRPATVAALPFYSRKK